MEKKLWAIYHEVDEDGGYGDAVSTETMIGVVQATEEEINAFVEKYDNPIVYDKPYADLYCHHIYAEEIKVETLDSIYPYGKDDNYGWMAKELEIKKEFDEKHEPDWRFSDNSNELYKELNKIKQEAREQWEKEHNA